MDFITALAEALCSEEVEQCQLACRGVVSQGERGMPRPCRGWKSLREWASMCVFVCVCVCIQSYYVCVCVAVNRRHKWGILREKICLTSSLPYGVCRLKKKRSYVTETSSEPMQVLCVCLPRSKNFLDSHPFQRKHCITPIYICNTHK